MSKLSMAAMSAFSGVAQCEHVEGRAEQAGLLRAEPDEAHRVARLDLLHLLGDLEDRARAGAVVVDAGAVLDAVEVRADDDDVVVAAGRLGDHVPRREMLEMMSTFTRTVRPVRPLRTPLGSSLPTAKVAASTGMSPVVAGLKPEAAAGRGVALVHEDDRRGAGVDRVLDLDDEVAGAALDQRDRAGREAREVGGLAAARRSRPVLGMLQVDRVQRRRDVLESAGARLVGVVNWKPGAYDVPPRATGPAACACRCRCR